MEQIGRSLTAQVVVRARALGNPLAGPAPAVQLGEGEIDACSDQASSSNQERSEMQLGGAQVIGPSDGRAGLLGSMGVRFMLAGDETGGGFSLVEHPIPPRALAAPLHRHSREDEYSFVLEGRLGALLGEDVVYGEVGDLIFKPRAQWHTFWNAGDDPARILEIISPAGFERYFEQMVDLLDQSAGPPDPSELHRIAARHGLEVDRESIPRLTETYGLRWGPSTTISTARPPAE